MFGKMPSILWKKEEQGIKSNSGYFCNFKTKNMEQPTNDNNASFWDKAKKTFEDIKDKAEDAFEDAREKVGDTWDKVEDAAEEAWDKIEDKAEDIKESAGKVWEDVKDKAEDFKESAEKVFDKTKDKVDSAADAVAGKAKEMIDHLKRKDESDAENARDEMAD